MKFGSSFMLDTFHALNYHMWLVALRYNRYRTFLIPQKVLLDSADLYLGEN